MQRAKRLGIAFFAACLIGAVSAVAALAAGAPENTVLPKASPNAPRQGSTELAGHGTWTNEPTGYSYQWQRCNAAGAECAAIGGASAGTYVPGLADSGHTLRVSVTARNATGEGTAVSPATEVVPSVKRPEIVPAPSAKEPLPFSGTGGFRFEGSVGFVVVCNSSAIIGEFVNAVEARNVQIKFSECSSGPSSFSTELLKGELGYLSEATHTFGLRLSPQAGGVWARNLLAGGEVLEGSVIGALSPANTHTNHFALKYKQARGVQELLHFEYPFEANRQLTRPGGTGGTVGIAAEPSLTTGRSVEIKG
jgi:hypothetical protein